MLVGVGISWDMGFDECVRSVGMGDLVLLVLATWEMRIVE